MKEVNKGILDNDVVISAKNIQEKGEVIALTCIKTVMFRSGKDLRCLYNGLLHDMNRSKDDYNKIHQLRYSVYISQQFSEAIHHCRLMLQKRVRIAI